MDKEEIEEMKKLICIVFMLMFLFVGYQKKATAQLIDTSLGWTPQLSFPMSTGIEGFWLPKTGQFAAGMSITAIEMKIPAITFLTFEGNALVAKGFGGDKLSPEAQDPLYGAGIKAATNLFEVSIADNVKLFPSLGTGLLNNFKEVKAWDDFIDGFRWTIYGTLIRWQFK